MSDLKSDADLLHLALTHEGDEFAARVVNDLQTQLAAMTAGRDALQTSMNELRKTCAEIIGADPQTWPDHGNAPLAIAACLGLRDAELQKTTAERDAALAKVAALREALVAAARSAEALKRECSMDPESPQAVRNGQYMAISYAARNALEATK